MKDLDENYEIIIVNDGSRDRSVERIDEFLTNHKVNIKIINHHSNKGYGASIMDGVIAANSNNIITIDADGTYPTKPIPKIVSYLDRFVLISGSRTGKKVKIPLIRIPGKFIHTFLISLIAGRYIPDMNSGLRAFRKDHFLRFLPLYPDGFSISTTFLLCSVVNGFPVKFVPINYFARIGRSKIKIFRDGFNFLLLILRAIMYFNPLRIFVPISIFTFFVGFFFLVYRLIIASDVPEISVLLIIVSILLVFFGLTADMVSKLFLLNNNTELDSWLKKMNKR